jgi:hypothetical protein
VCTAAVLDELAQYAPVTAVAGNNDGPDVAAWGAAETAALTPGGLPNGRGYQLTIVTDAVTDPDEGAHLNSLRAIFPRIAELATTEEVLTALGEAVPQWMC